MTNPILKVFPPSALLLLGLLSLPAQAQVSADGTVNTVVTPNGNTFTIEGGTTSGTNLFHSFSEFSVPTGSETFFNNATNITNIFSRVTGGSFSDIDGLIRANGTANLFLINPNGITFGENASINIGGSFFATTAETVVFSDNVEFSAVDPNEASLLTVNVLIGLQFGSNPNAIQVNGSGHNLSVDDVPFNEQLRTFAPLVVPDRTDRPEGLQVSSGNTLALVGGNITLSGGNLTAFAGRVELGSVAEARLVSLMTTSNGFTLDYSDINIFGDIELSQAASIDISGVGSGDLQIQGKTITLTDTSTLLSQTLGDQDGGHSILNASESILFQGTATADIPTAWFNRVEAGATGNGGTITIETGDLLIDTNAFISSSTLSSGDAGDVSVQAVNIETTKPIELILAKPTGLFSTVFPDATGMGGTLDIQTERLQMENVANIQAIVLGAGKGGDLQIQAQTVVVSTLAGLITNSFGSGNSGDLTIQGERLQAVNGGQVSTGTFASGDGGRLTIQTTETEILGAYNLELVGGFVFSGLFAGAQPGSTGNSNTLTIDTQSLRVADGGIISSATLGQGNGADMIIRAQDIEVSGALVDFGPAGAKSGILTSVNPLASGQAGNLIINTDRLEVTNGGLIGSQTDGSADAGNIQIAANSIEVSGSTILRSATQEFGVTPSEIAASSTTEFAAGSVLLDTDVLQVSNNGEITVSNTGTGDAGILNVMAGNISLNTGGSLRAEVIAGNQGNIDLTTELLLLRNNSNITTNAGEDANGGNITLETINLVALEDSDITANAVQGQGGNILIATESLFLSPDSEITASSQFGVDGVVVLNTPDSDKSNVIQELPADTVDATQQIVRGCQGNVGSNFAVSGRGGLPLNPSQQVSSSRPWSDIRDLSAFRENTTANTAVAVPSEVIIEANSWRINKQGNVELVAVVANAGVQTPNVTCAGTSILSRGH